GIYYLTSSRLAKRSPHNPQQATFTYRQTLKNTMTSAQAAQRVSQGPAASDVPYPSDMARQHQQTSNTTDIQEAIVIVTNYIRQNKHQTLGRREKLEDEMAGENKYETLESLIKRNVELRSRNKANDAKIAEPEAKISKDIAMDPIYARYILDCAHTRLALSVGLISAPPPTAEQGASIFRKYLERWTDTQERLAAMRDLFSKCNDDGLRNMSEKLLYDLTVNLNT
ncbi:hypothetical protein ARMSODRAFT_1028973, partial [Armillaria solidipes]